MDPEPLPLQSPVPLEASHDVSAFDCGAPALDEYLKKYALASHQSQSRRCRGSRTTPRVVAATAEPHFPALRYVTPMVPR